MLLLDCEGKERVRLEGYLPNSDFVAALESGLGRMAFVHKKYADAERWYDDVVKRFGQCHSAPGAMYWRAVARYRATNDHTVLTKVAEELQNTYPSSVWAVKAIPWLAKESKKDNRNVPNHVSGRFRIGAASHRTAVKNPDGRPCLH